MKKYVLISLILLAGCMPSSLPPPHLYALHAEAKNKVRPTISVQEPEVPPGFDTTRIALYLYGGRRLDYYARAAWPDRLNKVLQNFIVDALPSAVASGTGLPTPYTLLIKVNNFEPVYTAEAQAPPQLKVSLTFHLVSSASQKIIMNTTLTLKKVAAANTQTAIIEGLETLLAKACHEMARKLSGTARAPRALDEHKEIF